MATVKQSLEGYLNARANEVAHADLIQRWHWGMETQIQVRQGDGEPVDGKRNTFTDGVREWWHIRVPKNAKGTPDFRDYEIDWLLRNHVEAIGSTGWNWIEKRSKWMGADFDAIVGHAAGVGISDEELEEVRRRAADLPWVEVRRSTRGRGYHLYTYLEDEGIEIPNHTAHAAVCRAVLAQMSASTGFDFQAKVDVCGGNMWIDNFELDGDTTGLTLVVPATEPFKLSSIQWDDQLEVIQGTRTSVRVPGIATDEADEFDMLTSSRSRVKLDDTHRAIQHALIARGVVCNYVPDHNLFQLHTAGLKMLIDDENACEELGLQGVFDTLSPGTNLAEPNAFAFPEPDGSLIVYRFGRQVNETVNWMTTVDGWVKTTFNGPIDVESTLELSGGVLLPDGKSFQFHSLSAALAAAGKCIGFQSGVCPERLAERPCDVSFNDHGDLILTVDRESIDPITVQGFARKGAKKWTSVLRRKGQSATSTGDRYEIDAIVRRVQNRGAKPLGYYLRSHGQWRQIDKTELRDSLAVAGIPKNEMTNVCGKLVHDSWTEVCLHGHPEYPGDRQWNRNPWAPVKPMRGELPYWQKLFDHIGKALDSGTKRDPWCQQHGIDGSLWLYHWFGCIYRDPYCRVPAICCYSRGKGRGKTLVLQGCKVMCPEHWGDIYRPLTDRFNQELEGKVFGLSDEKDLRKGDAMELQRYVTDCSLVIRDMNKIAYATENSLHIVAAANDPRYFAIESGDRRRVLTDNIMPFDGPEIDESTFVRHLADELPCLFDSFERNPTPEHPKQLRMPTIATDDKITLMNRGNVKSPESEVLGQVVKTWAPAFLPDTASNLRQKFIEDHPKMDAPGQKTFSQALAVAGYSRDPSSKLYHASDYATAT
ncbi:primase-helicase family protein [Roseiconus lacunae]|uniref:primase-helicase family protein n=1 Tax=Roseiconus lacunae TaxID=2605694 RepID=UPI001E2CCFA4|nr:primase-helicase family protein [Roseiconus lacunae]MCD0462255.1 hypothetical protein [Roseiconus lacunae]